MWVNAEEWKKLNKRLREVETRLAFEDEKWTIRFPKYSQYNYLPYPMAEISVKDAISRIMSHLRLEFKYNERREAHVEVDIIPKEFLDEARKVLNGSI